MNILELDHLTISGDVYLGPNVTLRVRLFANRHSIQPLPTLPPFNPSGLSLPLSFISHAQGTVIIVANEGSRIDIPPGTILEDKVVTGNLRIMDH